MLQSGRGRPIGECIIAALIVGSEELLLHSMRQREIHAGQSRAASVRSKLQAARSGRPTALHTRLLLLLLLLVLLVRRRVCLLHKGRGAARCSCSVDAALASPGDSSPGLAQTPNHSSFPCWLAHPFGSPRAGGHTCKPIIATSALNRPLIASMSSCSRSSCEVTRQREVARDVGRAQRSRADS